MTTRKYLTILIVTAGVLAFGASNAQETETPDNNDGTAPAEQRPERQHRPPRRENMTEEQRAAARERWESMSEEERAALRERRQKMSAEERAAKRERWQNMSEEERQAKREEMRARRGDKNGKHPGGKRGGQRPAGGPPPTAEPDAV